MSITAADIVQTNTGSYNGTSGSISLPSGTTDGNTVVIAIMIAASASPAITGFTRSHGATTGSVRPYILQKAQAAAGETSWTTSVHTSAPVTWVAMEIQNLSKLNGVEVWATPAAVTQTGTSIVTTTTPSSYSYETLAFAIHGGNNTAAATAPAFTGHTGDFVEIATSTRTDGATGSGISVSLRTGLDIGTYQCTATSSVSLASANATIVVFNAENAKRVPNLDVMAGMEWGTAAGLTTGITGGPPFDSKTGTVNVTTTSPRTGTYALECVGTGAASNVVWATSGALGLYTAPTGLVLHRQYVGRFSVYFHSALPGADVQICAVDNNSGTSGAGFQMTYHTASQKIGVVVNQDSLHTGTEVLSATTVAANTWYNIDFYLNMTNQDREQAYHAYWRIDDVDQTTAVCTTTTTVSADTFSQWRLGWATSTTADIHFDDIVGSKHPGHYPLGDIKIYGIAADSAGTATVTTGANFSTFTNNGTLNATFSAATALAAVDDLPPTIGATADGFVQDTLGATDYVAVPMVTRDMATNLETPRGVRWYFPGWANAAGPTTAATIGFRGYDGTVETVLFAAAEPNFQNSTTAPAWICRMQKDLATNVPPILSQARTDALTARVGFSSDATPVLGVHATIAELAVRAAAIQQIMQVEETLYVYAYLDPDTSNYIALQLVAPPDADAWIMYRLNGVMQTPASITAGTSHTYIIGAESNATVDFISAGRV